MITFTIIESPFAPSRGTDPVASIAQHLRNLEYVRAAMADCFARGEIPYASHALYTQPGVLDDTIPEERRKGIDAGFAFRKAFADLQAIVEDLGDDYVVKTAVYDDLGVSPGMAKGIVHSHECGVSVEYRSLGRGW